jgi:hypothetical protein
MRATHTRHRRLIVVAAHPDAVSPRERTAHYTWSAYAEQVPASTRAGSTTSEEP